jgi:hypothetical protein
MLLVRFYLITRKKSASRLMTLRELLVAARKRPPLPRGPVKKPGRSRPGKRGGR